jgi:uncharacterized protein
MRPGIESFLEQQRIAVVGVSRKKGFGNLALRTLRARGWDVVPVSAAADAVEGERCYHAVADIPERPGAVLAVVPPAQADRVVDDCLAAGVRHLWFQQGSGSPEAVRRAETAGIDVVDGACVLMYAKPAGIHRLHRFLAGLRRER